MFPKSVKFARPGSRRAAHRKTHFVSVPKSKPKQPAETQEPVSS